MLYERAVRLTSGLRLRSDGVQFPNDSAREQDLSSLSDQVVNVFSQSVYVKPLPILIDLERGLRGMVSNTVNAMAVGTMMLRRSGLEVRRPKKMSPKRV